MTADGDYLSGHFGRASASRIQRVLEQGWQEFERLVQRHGWTPRPVPETSLDFALGKPPERGGLKLQVAIRDLPREAGAEPARVAWQRSAFNINWCDLTPSQARLFVTEADKPQKLPHSLIEAFSHTLRDSVRGQCHDWHRTAQRDGALYVQCIRKRDSLLTIRIMGQVALRQPARAFECQIHGRIVFDTQEQAFHRFDLVAAGQRSGTSQFNFRDDDREPAPMGVAYSLYKPMVTE